MSARGGRTVLGTLRLALLVGVLLFVALGAWLDRVRSRDWDAPLRVTIYPAPGTQDDSVSAYVRALQAEDFAALPEFFAREAARFGLALDEPIRVRVSHAAPEPPPALPARPGMLTVMGWSLRLRAHAARVVWRDPLPPPDVQLFATYAPLDDRGLPDSVGLSKGLVAVAHLYGDRAAAGSNAVVLAHELLHTLGARDKYARGSGHPLEPVGLGEPELAPRYPQRLAEIMAGRIALDAHRATVPGSLDDVVVGPVTAREIGWTR